MFLGLFCLSVLLIISIRTVDRYETDIAQADDTEEVVVKPMEKPNKDVVKILGIWLTNGYSLQPEDDYYTQVGQQIIIRTSAGRSVWSVLGGIFDGAHYRWYKTTDAGETWTEVPKGDGGQKMNMPVTPTEIGTTWYQLDTQYWNYATGWLLKTHIYSQVTAVHAKDPVNATGLKVTADDEYLYNSSNSNISNNSTHVHGYPTPSDANGTITYTVDNPDIADFTKDSDNGGNTTELVAKDGAIGKVKVTGTLHNPNGSTVSDSTTVIVGGGLDDQTVDIGDDATFDMQGSTVGDNDDADGKITIEWYRYDQNGKKTTVATSTASDYRDYLSYTVPNTTMDDDGTTYQAKLTFKYGLISSTSLTTNQAKLTVINKPDLTITNSVKNETYQSNNDDHILNGVTNDDKVTYNAVITENSDKGVLKDGCYVIPLYSGTKVDTVELDGTVLDPSEYSIVNNNEDGTDDLVITGLDYDGVDIRSHSVEVRTTVAGVTGQDALTYTPYAYGNSNTNEVYMTKGTPETINYVLDGFSVSVDDLNFGQIRPTDNKTLQYRDDEHNAPNGNVVKVNDQRRDKQGKKAYVSQKTPFSDTMGNILAASVRYYDNGNYVDLFDNKVLLHETTAGENFDSIGWDKENGLLLYIDDAFLRAGTYSAELSWDFEDSV